MSLQSYLDYPVCEKVQALSDGVRVTHSVFVERSMPQRIDFSHEVAFELASIPEIQAIFTSQLVSPQSMFFVWMVVPKRDLDLYRKIFVREQAIMERFQPIQFDFTIMPSGDHDPRCLVTDPSAHLVYIR